MRLPWDEKNVRKYIKVSRQNKINDQRNKIKSDYYSRWLEADPIGRKAIEANIDDGKVPSEYWPELCRYWGSEKKKVNFFN